MTEYWGEGFFLCICDTADIDTDCGTELFSDYRKRRLAEIKREAAKRQSIGAELALIHAVKRFAPDTELPLQYTAGEHGKPVPAGKLHFSLSHSGDKAVCIISNAPVGVDIQKNRHADLRLIERCCTDKEKALCPAAFMRLWTRKEAVVKADGRGLGAGIGKLDVRGDMAECSHCKYRIWDITAPEGYTIAAAKLVRS